MSSAFKEIDSDLFDKLTKKVEPQYYDPERPDVELQFCASCGACEDPEHCVTAIQCPKCAAPPMQLCTNENGGVTGYHVERHKAAYTPWFQRYRENR